MNAGIKEYSVAATALKSNAILRTLMEAHAAMANKFVPMGKQVLFVGETNAIEMKLADQVIGVDKIAEAPIVNGTIGKLAGFQLRIVPDTYLPEGLAFLIVTKGSAWAPSKVKTSRIITDPEDYAGEKVQYLEYHDCFVNEARKDTIAAYWTSAEPEE